MNYSWDLSFKARRSPGFPIPAPFAWFLAQPDKVILDGAEVIQWLDASGNNRHTDITATRPTFNATGTVNENGALEFNSTPFTCPASFYTLAAGSNTIYVVSKRATDSGVDEYLYLGTEGGANRQFTRYGDSTDEINYLNRNVATGFLTIISTQSILQWLVLTGKRVGTAVNIEAVSGAIAVSSGGASGVSETGIDAFTIGQDFVGSIAEIIFYNRALSESEDETVIQYLLNKYWMTVSTVTGNSPGTYTIGQDLTFILNFEFPVTVDTGGGTPYILVFMAEYGFGEAPAEYVSGSGTTALTFTYTIQAGDQAPEGVQIDSEIALNGAIIDSVISVFTPPVFEGIIVETISNAITTDAGDYIVTDAGDYIVTD